MDGTSGAATASRVLVRSSRCASRVVEVPQQVGQQTTHRGWQWQLPADTPADKVIDMSIARLAIRRIRYLRAYLCRDRPLLNPLYSGFGSCADQLNGDPSARRPWKNLQSLTR